MLTVSTIGFPTSPAAWAASLRPAILISYHFRRGLELAASLLRVSTSRAIDAAVSSGTDFAAMSAGAFEETEEKKKDFYLAERRYGSFERSFRVPESVDTDKIEATFKNGVLTLVLPKKPESQSKDKKISVKAA